MKYFVLVLLVLVIAGGVAQAATTTIQDLTTNGTSTAALDAYLRSDGQADQNFGAPSDVGVGPGADLRWYPDTNYGSKGPRHDLLWFDVSSVAPGATITSATLGIYLMRSSSSAPTVTGYQVSRLQQGSSWVEGLGGGTATANVGEPTWNSRAYGGTSWATPGGTGASDIDLATSKTLGAVTSAQGSGYRTIDVTDFVQGWVNGTWTNTGMLLWGGAADGTGGYWWLGANENLNVGYRPYLTITYAPASVPEPSSLLAFAGFGIAGLGLIRRRRA
jgi:hypothetical protein